MAKFLLEKSAPEWSSFTPVAMLTRSPLAIVSRANIKDANLTNLMEAASEKSNRLSVGETSNAPRTGVSNAVRRCAWSFIQGDQFPKRPSEL